MGDYKIFRLCLTSQVVGAFVKCPPPGAYNAKNQRDDGKQSQSAVL